MRKKRYALYSSITCRRRKTDFVVDSNVIRSFYLPRYRQQNEAVEGDHQAQQVWSMGSWADHVGVGVCMTMQFAIYANYCFYSYSIYYIVTFGQDPDILCIV